MQRRIFPWMGLFVLFLIFLLSGGVFAKETYKVRKGDSLYTISRKTGVSVDDLKAINGLNSDALKIHQKLIIPSNGKKYAKNQQSDRHTSGNLKKHSFKSNTYIVKKGDSIHSISRKTGLPSSDIKALNHLKSNRLRTGQRLVLYLPKNTEASVETNYNSDDSESAASEEEGMSDQEIISQEDLLEIEQDRQASDVLLGHWNSTHERDLLVKVAKGFLGAPYRLGGSSVRGLDCSAFVRKIYQFFDINLPRTAREQARVGIRVPRENLEEGDLVFFNTRRTFGHVGIYIGNNEFVHAASGRQRSVTISNLNDPYYDKHFIKAVRIKDLDQKV